MKKSYLVALALAAMPLSALAGDQELFYVAGGATKGKGSFSIGAGTKVDVLEISSINLGAVDGNASARFRGLSLVQNAVPVKDFNLLFRLGVGKTTTTFANGSHATRMGFSNGIILGAGGQYQLTRWFDVSHNLSGDSQRAVSILKKKSVFGRTQAAKGFRWSGVCIFFQQR